MQVNLNLSSQADCRSKFGLNSRVQMALESSKAEGQYKRSVAAKARDAERIESFVAPFRRFVAALRPRRIIKLLGAFRQNA